MERNNLDISEELNELKKLDENSTDPLTQAYIADVKRNAAIKMSIRGIAEGNMNEAENWKAEVEKQEAIRDRHLSKGLKDTPSQGGSSRPYTQNNSNSSGGCYIATAVYGSYDSPQVMVLRRYRDERLSKNIFGRLFIKAYYRLSPTVAKRLATAKRTNNFIRMLLDKIVFGVSKKQK
jgi:hypothetical protein